MFRGLNFFLRFGWKVDKRYIIYNILNQCLSSIVPVIAVLGPKYILEELMGSQRVEVLATYVGILVGYIFVANSLSSWLSLQSFTLRIKVTAEWGLFMHKKLAEADFENLESPHFLDLKEKADKFLYGDFHGFSYLFDSALTLIGQFFTLIGIISIIATMNIWMVILFLVLIMVSSWFESRAKKKDMELSMEAVGVERGWNYYSELFENFEYGKEIRMNHLEDWLLEKEKNYSDVAIDYYRRRNNFHIKSGIVTSAMTLIQQVTAYVYLLAKIISKDLSVGDFIMYLGAVTAFSEAMRKVMDSFVEIKAYGIYYDATMEYINVPMMMRQNQHKHPNETWHEIQFENVSFCYQGQAKDVLRNINLTIHQGERISVVGENGAGKTTLIKLLIRLYDPTEGRILMDGIDIREYDYEEYMELFSAVFQDFKLFAMPLSQNIKLSRHDKNERKNEIENILKNVGMENCLSELPKGMDTAVYKIFEDSGFEPSGGEGQKIALARAIYKDSPIVILDEPTAAFDPRAEYEMYKHFDELVEGKTAIYISHRLSSARFCDRILVLKEGEIIECGTHDELYETENGVYRELYQMQAQFYV